MTAKTMTVYVVIPDNDRPKDEHRVTVRTTEVSAKFLAGPERDCAMIPADLSLKAARRIAQWYAEHKDDDDTGCAGIEPAGD
jgi:hypothetical protein